MKLPRWLVIAMLTTSVLSVLVAAGWWWVTWPERTMDRFVEAADDSSFKALQGGNLRAIFDETKPGPMWRPTVIGSAPRSLMDFVIAQQEFDLEAPHNVLRLKVERGRVIDLLVDDPEGGGWVSFREIVNP
jgi:hypothetical protein